MDCRCGGTVRLEQRDVLRKWGPNGRSVIVAGVPTWVCERCREEVLERGVSQKLEELLRAGSVPGEHTEQLPVREFPSRQYV